MWSGGKLVDNIKELPITIVGVPVYRAGGYQRTGDEQIREKLAHNDYLRRGAFIYRREVPDCFGFLLSDEQANPKVQRQLYTGDAEHSGLERERGAAEQDERDYQEQSILVYLQARRTRYEGCAGRV